MSFQDVAAWVVMLNFPLLLTVSYFIKMYKYDTNRCHQCGEAKELEYRSCPRCVGYIPKED